MKRRNSEAVRLLKSEILDAVNESCGKEIEDIKTINPEARKQ